MTPDPGRVAAQVREDPSVSMAHRMARDPGGAGPGMVSALAAVAGNAATSHLLSVQREPNASLPSAAPKRDYATLAWPELLGHAGGAPGKNITSLDLKGVPTLKYADDKEIFPGAASAAPQGGGSATPEADAAAAAENAEFEAAKNRAVTGITAARARIPLRIKIPYQSMEPSPNNKAGYDYNPDTYGDAQPYNTWNATALPTGVSKDDWNWRVFTAIQRLEGQAGRLTTFDKTLTIGAGFSSAGGAAQRILGRVFVVLPEVAQAAFEAGLAVDGKGAMSVVDPSRKWILDGEDAAAYVQTSPELLSFIVDISQGTQPVGPGAVADDERDKQRQAFLNAEWAEFVSGTMSGMTSLVRGWAFDSAVLAVHAKHAAPGFFPYTFWDKHNNPDLATMVATIFATAGDDWGRSICTQQFAQFQPRTGK